jgi:hypothetical protein
MHLNFLDITLKRMENKHLRTEKPAITDCVIPRDSCHPVDKKFAAIRYFSSRLRTYPLEKKENEK